MLQALTDILNELDEVRELLLLTRAEIFVGVFRHKMYFLPASTYLPVRGRWMLPRDTVMVSFIKSSALTALDKLSSFMGLSLLAFFLLDAPPAQPSGQQIAQASALAGQELP